MPNSESIIATFKAITPLEKRMAAIHSYVNQHFSWNRLNSKYAQDGIKEVWEKQKGNSGEINLLLINLLKSADIDAYPLLVSERTNGKVTTDYPILDQFNKTLAYVQLGNKNYVIDGTDEYTPMTLIACQYFKYHRLCCAQHPGRIIELKDEAKANTNVINMVNKIKNDGALAGEALIVSSDYARVSRLRNYAKKIRKNLRPTILQVNMLTLPLIVFM